MNWKAFFVMLGAVLGGFAFIALSVCLAALAAAFTGSTVAGLLVLGVAVAVGFATLFGLVAP